MCFCGLTVKIVLWNSYEMLRSLRLHYFHVWNSSYQLGQAFEKAVFWFCLKIQIFLYNLVRVIPYQPYHHDKKQPNIMYDDDKRKGVRT